ncbi:putative membrane protein [Mycetocola sp. CAN_C7]|uniref:YidH family protein n=1 Tax=Mycetocola sp. CAN_C7 TaxID=2787724 RepID=UPI0018CB775D
MPKTRFPAAVFGHGQEPDARFTLANERTFLAWIRTSLALIAAGVALEALPLPIEPTLRLVSAFLFLALGVLAPAHAWVSWVRIERALRESNPLPGPGFSGILAAGVIVGGLLVGIGLLV